MRHLLDSDAIEDVIGDFHLAILEEDMRKLRMWYEGPRRARLASWLTMIASQIAVDHIRRACRERAARIIADVEPHDDDPNRGGEWLGANHGERFSMEQLDAALEREQRRGRASRRR
jgi:DNA-directed RNA polymerase specialized sigma24 family protein